MTYVAPVKRRMTGESHTDIMLALAVAASVLWTRVDRMSLCTRCLQGYFAPIFDLAGILLPFVW
jgi:hypothetical protein